MKGERDKNSPASDKLWDCMLIIEGLRASETLELAPRGSGFNETHLKCFYANSCSMRNKQRELEAWAQSQNYGITGLSEAWWEEACDWCVATDSYRQGRHRSGAALYLVKAPDCLELAVSDNVVESLWVRIKVQANKGDVVVGVYNRPPGHDEDTDSLKN